MSEIPKTYEPQAIEEKWYAFWTKEGCFVANPDSGKPAYSIVIPPPNVTGILTIGHVLNNTIQDILARRARMLGKEVLWLPGTDHAGIATQNVVEKNLRKEGVMRHRDDLGREALVARIWEWKEKYGGIIIQQLKKLGASCDWSRERFTMDPAYSACIARVFVDLFGKGMIHRGKRMVNWDPAALTALSDEEVENVQQSGFLYYFKVEVVEEPGTFLTIATTRPETIPGDTAVAVNPGDSRYARYIGKHVRRPLPLENQAPLPIIGDEKVEFEFGTGVLKVTPAHDKTDFEIGQRHRLELIDVMYPNGVMNGLAGADLAGLDRFEARKTAVEKLRELGALEKEEPYQNTVGVSQRSQAPVEPRLSEQWFLKYPSQKAARETVASGEMRFFPERWAKVYDHWMENLQDWCISRQLWWGHRIPVWSRTFETEEQARNEVFGWEKNGAPNRRGHHLVIGNQVLVCTDDADAASILEPRGYQQDPDVLDTWFSSWLWPFSTMGWPENTETLRRFYPTTDLVTGPDIIFFWVARMIMAGFEYMGALPFRNVYFTGILRDKFRRKISKSLGNSPDPLDLIARYGADALRFGVMRSAPLGQDIIYDEKSIENGRNFCTKLWNACRFRQMQGGASEGEIVPTLLTGFDRWILRRLDRAISEVSEALDEYRFSDAAAALYRFFWSEFCDWYLEASKATLTGSSEQARANTLAVIDFVLSHTLRLFHPFMPFITEELWFGLGYQSDLPPGQGGATIMFANWPKPLGDDFCQHYGVTDVEEQLTNDRIEVVNAGRGLRRDFNIASNKRVRFVLHAVHPISEQDCAALRLLLNAEELEIVDAAWAAAKGTPAALTPLGELFLPLEGLIDVVAEKSRLEKELVKAEQELAKVRAKLADEAFTKKVPEAVLAEHRQREVEWAEKAQKIRGMQEALQ